MPSQLGEYLPQAIVQTFLLQVRRFHLVQHPGNHHRSPSLTGFATLDPSMGPPDRPSVPRLRRRCVEQRGRKPVATCLRPYRGCFVPGVVPSVCPGRGDGLSTPQLSAHTRTKQNAGRALPERGYSVRCPGYANPVNGTGGGPAPQPDATKDGHTRQAASAALPKGLIDQTLYARGWCQGRRARTSPALRPSGDGSAGERVFGTERSERGPMSWSGRCSNHRLHLPGRGRRPK